jgi:hypothetical protein
LGIVSHPKYLHCFGGRQNSPQKTRENIALFIGMGLFIGLNYLGQRFVVFRQKQE